MEGSFAIFPGFNLSEVPFFDQTVSDLWGLISVEIKEIKISFSCERKFEDVYCF